MRTAAVLRAALAASCLRGALPPVDLRAVCLVRAIENVSVVVEGGDEGYLVVVEADEDDVGDVGSWETSSQMRPWLYTDATASHT